MPLLAIPNISEGRDQGLIDRLLHAVTDADARLLDTHSDRIHNRTVLTFTGTEVALVDALVALAKEAAVIDMTVHEGVHPRLGGLDVCPIVPHNDTIHRAAKVAHRAGESIALAVRLPVYYYGAASSAQPPRELPDLRRGGLDHLMRRAFEGTLVPDAGSREIDPHSGVVCVGARDHLIAFNVWLNGPLESARAITAWLRGPEGPPGVRALAFPVGSEMLSQVSMNLVDPGTTGIDAAFEAVAKKAEELGVVLRGTEIVGLVPAEFMPDAKSEAARLLISPGRSVEAALGD